MKRFFRLGIVLSVTTMVAFMAESKKKVIMPPSLVPGDKVAICTPASAVDSAAVMNAVEVLSDRGWQVEVMPHALERSGSYGGADADRLADLRAAFADPRIKAVLCSRGGYGAVHLLHALDSLDLRRSPKWVVGFSDITAIHGLMRRRGLMSIHGSMAVTFGSDSASTAGLLDVLSGRIEPVRFAPHPFNRCGKARGRLAGGNVAVMAHLIDTPFDLIEPGTILFIEDVGEPIYKIERILWQLRLSGALGRIAGLIVGEFTDYEADWNYADMESMIRDMVSPYGFPVVFGAPVGHGKRNVPLIESATVTFEVTHDGAELRYTGN